MVYTFLGLHGVLLCGWYDVCFGSGRIGNLGNVLFDPNAEMAGEPIFFACGVFPLGCLFVVYRMAIVSLFR